MLDRSSKFFLLSKEIAERFLQTTVIVDDQASFGGETPDSAEPVSNLKTPARGRGKSTVTTPAIITSVTASQESAHQFDAKTVIDNFASKGIVCSVLKPDATDKQRILPIIEKLAICTDIFIVDWDLCKDNGEQTLKLIESITKSSLAPSRKLRLIAVYTGEPGIVDIAKKIKTALFQPLESTSIKDNIREEDDGFAFIIGSTRVVIFAKPNTDKIPQHLEYRKVSFHELAEKVIEEFTLMTAGLVSNVVLDSLASVRTNTYKILGKFGSELDAPYLTHRALMENPIDAEDHLSSLIGQELQGILNEAKISDKANLDAINLWCQAHHIPPYKLVLSDNTPKELSHDQVIELLSDGPENWSGLTDKKKKQIHTHAFTDMFKLDSTSNSSALDEKFAIITTHRSYYGKGERVLGLGTIVKYEPEEHPHTYYVCVQPRCDSTRINESRAFPFLPLNLPKGDNKFDTIVDDEGTYVRLKISKKSYDIKLHTFSPILPSAGIIVSQNCIFKDINGEKFSWIGELRFEHAQRLSNSLAAEISRVGLDESEWLRRWS